MADATTSTTASTTWSGGQIVNPLCYGCFHHVLMHGKSVCHCASRTMSSDGKCLSYLGRDAR